MRKLQGFTLIELLIVVAIIAILAAIAVPNFLDAQVRSKVSRAKTDMRTLEIALESYRIDNNKYPFTAQKYKYATLHNITTPLAYMSAIPQDPFQPVRPDDGFAGVLKNMYGTGHPYFYWGEDVFKGTGAFGIRWSATSAGPDKGILDDKFAGANPAVNFFTQKAPDGTPPYDPSNGTVSRGNIVRMGPGNIPQELTWSQGLRNFYATQGITQ